MDAKEKIAFEKGALKKKNMKKASSDSEDDFEENAIQSTPVQRKRKHALSDDEIPSSQARGPRRKLNFEKKNKNDNSVQNSQYVNEYSDTE